MKTPPPQSHIEDKSMTTPMLERISDGDAAVDASEAGVKRRFNPTKLAAVLEKMEKMVDGMYDYLSKSPKERHEAPQEKDLEIIQNMNDVARLIEKSHNSAIDQCVEKVWELLMDSLPASAENLATLIPEHKQAVYDKFLRHYQTNLLSLKK